MLILFFSDAVGTDLIDAISATICNLELLFISLTPLLISYSITFHPLSRYPLSCRFLSLLAHTASSVGKNDQLPEFQIAVAE